MSSTRVRSGKCRSSTARVSFGTRCSQLPWWPLRTEAAAGRLRRADSRRRPAAGLARTMSLRGACCGQAASEPNREKSAVMGVQHCPELAGGAGMVAERLVDQGSGKDGCRKHAGSSIEELGRRNMHRQLDVVNCQRRTNVTVTSLSRIGCPQAISDHLQTRGLSWYMQLRCSRGSRCPTRPCS